MSDWNVFQTTQWEEEGVMLLIVGGVVLYNLVSQILNIIQYFQYSFSDLASKNDINFQT